MAGEKLRGVTIPIGADTTEFNKGVKKMDTSIRGIQSQVKALEESLKIEWDPKRFEQAQKLAQKAISETETKAKALKDQLSYMEQSGVDPNNDRYQKLQAQLVKTEADAIKLKKQLDDINNIKLDRIVSGFKNVGDAISNAGKALVPFSAAAAGVLVGMGKIATDTIKTASEIDDLSQMVNMNAESLQKWRYIAMQLGSDNATLQTALTKTQAAFADLSVGVAGPASKALEVLGFSAEEAAKGMDANFEQMIKRLASVQDAATQAYLVNELFGDRLGSKLIPMLNGGAEGLAQLTSEFEALGYMSNQQIQALSSFDDELNKVKTAFGDIKNDLAVALLPVMESLVSVIQERIIPAFRSLTDWFSGLSDKGRQTIITVLGIVAALAPALIIIGKLTSGVGSLIGVISKLPALLSVLSAHPIIAIIGVIAALIMTLFATNEQFRESISNLVAILGDALAPILEIIMQIFGQLMEVINPILNLLGDILTPIIDVLSIELQAVGQVLQAALIPAFKAMQPMITMMLNLLKPLINILLSVLVPAIEYVGKMFSSVFGFIQGIMNDFLKGIEWVFNKAIDLINGLIRGINKLGGWLGISLKELDKVKLTVENKNNQSEYESPNAPSIDSVDKALNQQEVSAPINTIINNNQDNSSKNITIGPGAVVIQNYAAEADVEGMADKIMVLLAEGM